MKKLAIIDWGIGGISIYKLVKEELSVPVVYLSDTGAIPYGKMKRPELIARLISVIAFLRNRDVTHLVIGCNAASTAIPFLDDQGITIEGMIDNAVAASIRYKPESLAIIGGRRTVLSGVYRKGFAERGVKIQQRIAQPLSALIESGDISSNKLHGEAKKILDPIKNCSHILLACTHYPAIIPLLEKLVSEKTEFIDPAGSLLQTIKKWKIDNVGTDEFFTTGDPKSMKRSAKLAFGVDVPVVKTISI